MVFLYTGHQGYRFEIDLPTFSLIARVYSPVTARFLSRDPLGSRSRDWNVYRYVGNRPIIAIDPSGLDWDFPTFLSDCAARRNPFSYRL